MTPEEFASLKVGDTVWVDVGGSTKPFEALVLEKDRRPTAALCHTVKRKTDGECWYAESKHLFANRHACLDARETKLRESCTKAEFALSRARERLAKFKKWRSA